MIKCMKMLGNSLRGINPPQNHRFYRCCVLPIALYGFQLWYYNKAPLSYPLNTFQKMQHRAALWISGVFQTLPLAGIKAISGLIPIHLHIKKLYNRALLRGLLLLFNHIIKSILSSNRSYNHVPYNSSIDNLTPK